MWKKSWSLKDSMEGNGKSENSGWVKQNHGSKEKPYGKGAISNSISFFLFNIFISKYN